MAKKNFVRTSLTNKINSAMGFTYPMAHEGKKTYVDFYVFDPSTGERRRVKKFFDFIKKKRERKEAIAHYIATMSRKLRQGWNPFVECGNQGLTHLDTVLTKYESSLLQYSRKKTVQSYTSRLSILKKYISELPFPPQYAYQLDEPFFIEFLDWLLDDREVSIRTRNNYKGWVTSFCEWMAKRKYIENNPGHNIPKLKEDEKQRRALTPPELKKLFSWAKENDKYFLLACLFQYYTFIRPTELSHIKIGDINIKDQCIYINGAVSKNRRDGAVALNKQLILLMVDLGTFKNDSEKYLFGKNFMPNTDRIGPDQFNKRFAKVRKILKFSNDLKFYSLKDSGIRDLANAKGIVTARDQARHTDISTTNKYLSGRDQRGPDGAKDFQIEI